MPASCPPPPTISSSLYMYPHLYDCALVGILLVGLCVFVQENVSAPGYLWHRYVNVGLERLLGSGALAERISNSSSCRHGCAICILKCAAGGAVGTGSR